MTPTFPHELAPHPDAVRKKLYMMMPQGIDDLFALAFGVEAGQDDDIARRVILTHESAP